LTGAPRPLLGGAALGDTLDRLWRAVTPIRAVEGWATVELDRATVEVADALASLGRPTSGPAPDDELLGASVRLLRFPAGHDVLLLEPATEGLLAASLARFGEGALALYLEVAADGAARAAAAGIGLSAEATGPLGRQRRVTAGPRWGPHLIVATPARAAPPATIAP
jgi:hypothetical protein